MKRDQLTVLMAVLAAVILPYALCEWHDRKNRIHCCKHCRHVMPSQRRDWHRGVRKWYSMIGEGRTWE